MRRSILLFLALIVQWSAHAAPDPAAYDRNNDGRLDAREMKVWVMHTRDPLLAKYDVNFDGTFEKEEFGADELEALRKDKKSAYDTPPYQVDDDLLYYGGMTTIEDIKLAAAKREGAKDTPKCGEDRQTLFVRRDRLDTSQYREQAAVASVQRSSAKGAAVSFTQDGVADATALTVNGRISYLAAAGGRGDPCAQEEAEDKNPYPPTDPFDTTVWAYAIAPWMDAQGTLNSPKKAAEKNNLQFGVDAQLRLGGGSVFDLQYLVLSPYWQTDFRGNAQAFGVRAGWEPLSRDLRLGGRVGTPNRILDWYWQLRAELDVKDVHDVGNTGLKADGYTWLGGVVRANFKLFPDRTRIHPAEKPVAPGLTDRIYASATAQYFYDFSHERSVHLYGGEVGYNLTTDGKSSLSLQYNRGRDKDTLEELQKYVVSLNFKY